MTALILFLVFCVISTSLHTTATTASTPSTTSNASQSIDFDSLLKQVQHSSLILQCCIQQTEHIKQHTLKQKRVQVNSVEGDSNDDSEIEAVSEWLNNNEASIDELSNESTLSLSVSNSVASLNSVVPRTSNRDRFRAWLSSYIDPSQSSRQGEMFPLEQGLRKLVCNVIRPGRTETDPILQEQAQTRRQARGELCEYTTGPLPSLSDIERMNSMVRVEDLIARLDKVKCYRSSTWEETNHTVAPHTLSQHETLIYKALERRLKQLQQQMVVDDFEYDSDNESSASATTQQQQSTQTHNQQQQRTGTITQSQQQSQQHQHRRPASRSFICDLCLQASTGCFSFECCQCGGMNVCCQCREQHAHLIHNELHHNKLTMKFIRENQQQKLQQQSQSSTIPNLEQQKLPLVRRVIRFGPYYDRLGSVVESVSCDLCRFSLVERVQHDCQKCAGLKTCERCHRKYAVKAHRLLHQAGLTIAEVDKFVSKSLQCNSQEEEENERRQLSRMNPLQKLEREIQLFAQQQPTQQAQAVPQQQQEAHLSKRSQTSKAHAFTHKSRQTARTIHTTQAARPTAAATQTQHNNNTKRKPAFADSQDMN